MISLISSRILFLIPCLELILRFFKNILAILHQPALLKIADHAYSMRNSIEELIDLETANDFVPQNRPACIIERHGNSKTITGDR